MSALYDRVVYVLDEWRGSRGEDTPPRVRKNIAVIKTLPRIPAGYCGQERFLTREECRGSVGFVFTLLAGPTQQHENKRTITAVRRK